MEHVLLILQGPQGGEPLPHGGRGWTELLTECQTLAATLPGVTRCGIGSWLIPMATHLHIYSEMLLTARTSRVVVRSIFLEDLKHVVVTMP